MKLTYPTLQQPNDIRRPDKFTPVPVFTNKNSMEEAHARAIQHMNHLVQELSEDQKYPVLVRQVLDGDQSKKEELFNHLLKLLPIELHEKAREDVWGTENI